jgi:NADP-dependent 3-hydroxy acid dehydrogenase YdfG
MDRNIAGKVVVITGASSGLGEATARHLSAEGATVVLGARRVDRLKALVDELTRNGGKALAASTDVTDRNQVKSLVDAAVQTFGRIDVMISPGAVATELPQSSTERDAAEEMTKFYDAIAIPADSFARAVGFAMSQPADVDVNEILFRPTRQEL